MNLQFIYVLVSSDKDYYLEELWASAYSLRLFHPKEEVIVLADKATTERILQRKQLTKLLSRIITADVPETYSPKERSRDIKTRVRDLIEGDFLFIDTDTIITHSLADIDKINADIAAVPDAHTSLSEHPFGDGVRNNVKRIFNEDISNSAYWFNSGVMLVRDTPIAHKLYKRWNENWKYSTFERSCSQDQPALIKTDKEFGYIIQKLPDIYNCQLALSIKYFYEAKIVHFWHMDFIADQSYSPFMGLDVYKQIKKTGSIDFNTAKLIENCKSAFKTTTMIVGQQQIYFLFSPCGQIFCKLHQNSKQWAHFLDKAAMYINIIPRIKRKLRKILYRDEK